MNGNWKGKSEKGLSIKIIKKKKYIQKKFKTSIEF